MSKKITFEDRPVMKCGCVAMAINQSRGGIPCCFTHDCDDIGEQPNLDGRIARCAYFGKPVKESSYNGNCCNTCRRGDICRCEKPSSSSLWFFIYKPQEEFDEYYCACHGCD